VLSDAEILAELEATGQPGLTVGVTDRDATISIGTYGLAEIASGRPVDEETLFEIGSIGKTFTAILVLQLAEEGAIDLDAPVAAYLPWFEVPQPDGAEPIAVAHLLSHTSGLAAGIDGTPEAAFQVWSLRDLPTRSLPGERFHYSNVGFKALGLVLEAVTGSPYPELLRTRILEPLGMTATEPAITNEIRDRLAVGYEYLHDDRTAGPRDPLVTATWLETATADGSIASNARDMCAFARMLLRGGEPVLGADAFARMSAPHARVSDTVAYGYGLLIRELEGRRTIGHGGGMVGYLAGLQVDVEAGIGAIVLQNGYGTSPMRLARLAIGVREPDAGEAPRAEHAAPQPSPIAGRYRSHIPWATSLEVVDRGGEPWLLFGSSPDGFDDGQRLVPDGDLFRVGDDPGNPETMRFDTELDGRTLRAWLSGWPFYRVD
jgi:CubicO group peptidase (beta-lactamase class C family)